MSSFSPTYKFTDQENDPESGLMYYDARYYNQTIGRFTQSDPLALIIALNKELKNTTGKEQQNLLKNPQLLNYYSYAVNNPLIYIDPNGQLRVHYSDDMTDEQKEQFNQSLQQLTETVKNNQEVIDYFNEFDVDIVETLEDPDKGPDIYFNEEIVTNEGQQAYGQYNPKWWKNDITISLKAINKGLQTIGSTLIHELGHYANDVGTIFGWLDPDLSGKYGDQIDYLDRNVPIMLNSYLDYYMDKEYGYLAEYLTYGCVYCN